MATQTNGPKGCPRWATLAWTAVGSMMGVWTNGKKLHSGLSWGLMMGRGSRVSLFFLSRYLLGNYGNGQGRRLARELMFFYDCMLNELMKFTSSQPSSTYREPPGCLLSMLRPEAAVESRGWTRGAKKGLRTVLRWLRLTSRSGLTNTEPVTLQTLVTGVASVRRFHRLKADSAESNLGAVCLLRGLVYHAIRLKKVEAVSVEHTPRPLNRE